MTCKFMTRWMTVLLLTAGSFVYAPHMRAQVSASISPWNNVEAVFVSSELSPNGTVALHGIVNAAPDVVSRVIWDDHLGIYTGYDIALTVDRQAKGVRVFIEPTPLTSEYLSKRLGARWNPSWRKVALNQLSSPETVHLGDSISISLWKEAGVTAVDRVSFRFNNSASR